MDDPGKTAAHSAPTPPKRFYQRADLADRDGGFALLLDGKPVRTPGKRQLLLPSRGLAEAVAEEWRAQKERIDPVTMPLTKLANSAIDGVPGREDEVIGDILNYAGSDLLCYRAEGPRGLIEAKRAHWDPVLDWVKSELGATFVIAGGIVLVA